MALDLLTYSRRQWLQLIGATMLGNVLPARLLHADDALKFKVDPFPLGVASGCPEPNTVVLWTRILSVESTLVNSAVPVEWAIASDEHFKNIVEHGTYHATAEWAHSVHVEPKNLLPGRDYWYRFTAGGQQSPIGRTRTAPALNSSLHRLRIAVASCQKYDNGYYVAYRHMLEDNLDLIVHVGDYIYEYGSTPNTLVRGFDLPQAVTLDDYRAHYAIYKSDPDLRAAHAAHPWLMTWDDHEVSNDYAGDRSYDEMPDVFLLRRAVAYRAYYEHMPLPSTAIPVGPDMRINRQNYFGNLVNICMLDSRQHRSWLACLGDTDRNPRGADCPELYDTARTKLGTQQEEWLTTQLVNSKARWNIVAQGTPMAHVDQQPGPGEAYRRDSWDGYPAARQRFLDTVVKTKVTNPVVIDGDIHAFQVANLNKRANDLRTPIVASEFTASSITSSGISQRQLDERRQDNPNVLLSDATYRGYLLMDINAQRLHTDLVAMETIREPTSARRTLASYVVENGKPGPIKTS